MLLPFLHPLHATTSAEHVILWAVAGLGIGLAVIVGRHIFSGFSEGDGPDDGSRRDDPPPPPAP